jgi:hypothetical protein
MAWIHAWRGWIRPSLLRIWAEEPGTRLPATGRRRNPRGLTGERRGGGWGGGGRGGSGAPAGRGRRRPTAGGASSSTSPVPSLPTRERSPSRERVEKPRHRRPRVRPGFRHPALAAARSEVGEGGVAAARVAARPSRPQEEERRGGSFI